MKKINRCSLEVWVCYANRCIVQLESVIANDKRYAVAVHLDVDHEIGSNLSQGWVKTDCGRHFCYRREFERDRDNLDYIWEACQAGGFVENSNSVWNVKVSDLLVDFGISVSNISLPVAHPPIEVPTELSLEELSARLQIAERKLKNVFESIQKPLIELSKAWDEYHRLLTLKDGGFEKDKKDDCRLLN